MAPTAGFASHPGDLAVHVQAPKTPLPLPRPRKHDSGTRRWTHCTTTMLQHLQVLTYISRLAHKYNLKADSARTCVESCVPRPTRPNAPAQTLAYQPPSFKCEAQLSKQRKATSMGPMCVLCLGSFLALIQRTHSFSGPCQAPVRTLSHPK